MPITIKDFGIPTSFIVMTLLKYFKQNRNLRFATETGNYQRLIKNITGLQKQEDNKNNKSETIKIHQKNKYNSDNKKEPHLTTLHIVNGVRWGNLNE